MTLHIVFFSLPDLERIMGLGHDREGSPPLYAVEYHAHSTCILFS